MTMTTDNSDDNDDDETHNNRKECRQFVVTPFGRFHAIHTKRDICAFRHIVKYLMVLMGFRLDVNMCMRG